ncbi:GTPase HflX, partial [Enterobacter mori]
MSQQLTHNTEKRLETAILVGVHAQSEDEFNLDSTMEELASLSETCQLNV